MIVKILSSSATFSGVVYNEDKVEKGTAELLAAENFGMLQPGRSGIGDTDYKSYFQSWSKADGNIQKVKQPQFHAVISCEGRGKDAVQLQEIAEQYLRKMGYGDNPYLIYFHTDTPNNHVHLVSTRINREGKKIDDSFERTRSQKAMKEILLQDVGEEVRKHLQVALGYNFSTAAQLKLLLEREGVKVKETATGYSFIKYGSHIHSMGRDAIAKRTEAYVAPKARIHQLRAILSKYKAGLSPQELKDFLQHKFGVELVFHQTKGKPEPYGYTILDHGKKEVFKGAQVMKLNELLLRTSDADRIASAQAIVSTLTKNSGVSYGELKGELQALGFTLTRKGEVRLRGGETPILQVTPETMRAVHYNERLQHARLFSTSSMEEAQALARVFYLRPGSLRINTGPDEGAREYTADKLNSMLANGIPFSDIIERNGWSLVRVEGEHYLIDKGEKTIHKIGELTDRNLEYSRVNVLEVDSRIGVAVEYDNGAISEMLLSVASMVQTGNRQLTPAEKRNKRRIKR
ncbi:relaxase/mobilization nuclease-like protein [Pontibacter ummariensis]|uniref:Relaxase/Mobilisation nuclease domain-containing protein n=1 Tax=Pontibacter ummariensis TaxID=1610492 RepID=A0A239IZZ2_9BACT|nr:relaxase/mobilization nuclease domain-containing protein [Pontibacter ummariensis]PRY09041.1 relaxase/mobilization nuclease-like protein [Pontibacter ummariensis]SNS98962.1 Relaxase/Mobilisation nuclease domain-containing protein [Pontibacter ummariensis]